MWPHLPAKREPDPMTAPSNAELSAEIIRLTTEAGTGKSIAPSDVARALAPPAASAEEEAPWRGLMTRVRKVALTLQAEGRIDILRKGKPVPAEDVRGVIRFRLHETA
jgi:hypothetical protein